MKKITMIALTAFLASFSSFAAGGESDTKCYRVANEGSAFSKTPELLCIRSFDEINVYEITLESGLLEFNRHTIAAFQFNLLSRSRCLNCNEDVFGIANPENSTFNSLQIKFSGTKLNGTSEETGTIEIGGTTLSYKSL